MALENNYTDAMENEVRITFRLPQEVADAMRRLAEDHDRSLNGEVVWALRQYIRSQEREAKPGTSND
jgi:hypothetical protein